MPAISFLIATLLGTTSFIFWKAASQIIYGTEWATSVCKMSRTFCQHPEFLAYASAVMLIVGIGAKLGSAK